jgi:hypothetical protein
MKITNEQIADKVMGWTVGIYADDEIGTEFYISDSGQHHLVDEHDFLNDMNAALVVIEKMTEKGFYFKTERRVADKLYEVLFVKPFDMRTPIVTEHKSYATAICTAALQALESEY